MPLYFEVLFGKGHVHCMNPLNDVLCSRNTWRAGGILFGKKKKKKLCQIIIIVTDTRFGWQGLDMSLLGQRPLDIIALVDHIHTHIHHSRLLFNIPNLQM